jgi:trans-aconitate methyltransferase
MVIGLDERRLYGDLAWLWPIISPPADYEEEAEDLAARIRQFSRIPVSTLLHLGSGGGHLDHRLQQYFTVTGVDCSPSMLALARALNPAVRYLPGDMRDVRLDESFDAALIADSIDYMLDESELLHAFTTVFAHLRPGGVFLTYAETTSEQFQQHRTTHSVHRQGSLEVVMVENSYDPDPTDTRFDSTFVYLVRREGELQIMHDRHQVGLFPRQTWGKLLRVAGFELAWEELRNEILYLAGVRPI